MQDFIKRPFVGLLDGSGLPNILAMLQYLFNILIMTLLSL